MAESEPKTQLTGLKVMHKAELRSVVYGHKQYPAKSKPFWVPSLELLAPHVEAALRENYKNVQVRSLSP